MTDRPIPDLDAAQSILDFWLGVPGTSDHAGPRGIWFKKDAAFDASIREQHGKDYENARNGFYDDWELSGPTSLALVITLDQFPRNLFRDDARAFATDEKALAVAQSAITQGFDTVAPPHHRIFYYMPFEHSEDIIMQKRCLDLIKTMPEFEMKDGYYVYAVQHHKIIQRFGRFPHRNKILGRESTPEEIEFLTQPGSGF